MMMMTMMRISVVVSTTFQVEVIRQLDRESVLEVWNRSLPMIAQSSAATIRQVVL